MRNNKPKTVALVVLIVAVIGLTVAFAVLSSNLTISGNAKLDPVNWNIYFDNIANIKAERKASIKSNPIIDTNDKRKISGMFVTLTEPGDKVSSTVDIVSESDIDAAIDSILKKVTVKPEGAEHGFIDFNVYYIDTNVEVKEDDTIDARENEEPTKRNITIVIYYNKENVTNKDLDEMPSGGLEIGFDYGLIFKQSNEIANITTTKYISGCTEFTKKDTYEVGVVIAFCNTNTNKSEDFYVIKDNGDTVTALAKYNLMVGNKVVYDDGFENVLSKTALTNSDKDYGLQSDLTRMEVTEEGMPTSTTLYGTMAFAGKDGSNMLANCAGNGCYLGYWANSDGSLKDSYKNGNQTSYPVYVFESNSLLWEPIQKYQAYFISTLKKTTVEMRLLTYNELIGLGCNPTEYKCTKNFVYKNINYWSAYAYDYNGMWIVTVAGFLNGDEDLWHDNLLGTRPVITINKSEI